MRGAVIRSAAVVALAGALTGVLVALGLRWWAGRGHPSDFGWYAYSPPRRYVDYLPVDVGTDWWALLWPAAVTGLVLALVVSAALALSGRRITVARVR